eukprot:1159402-Pelagomonas_calceolata.AAC.17
MAFALFASHASIMTISVLLALHVYKVSSWFACITTGPQAVPTVGQPASDLLINHTLMRKVGKAIPLSLQWTFHTGAHLVLASSWLSSTKKGAGTLQESGCVWTVSKVE